MKISKLTLAIAGCLLALAAQTSKAITYSLDLGNSGLGGNANYGSVTVTLVNSTTADITFSANPGYQFTDGSSAAVNVNASGFTESLISDPSFKQFNTGSIQVDGWGNFNLTLDQNSSGPSDRTSTIMFSVTDTSGTWGSATDVLALNNGSTGYILAAHIYVNNGGFTGYASSDQNSSGDQLPVPDGGTTIMMLGSALAGLGIVGRRIRKS